MNRPAAAFATFSWLVFVASGACQGPEPFDRGPDTGHPGAGGTFGVGGDLGSGGTGVGGRGAGGFLGMGGARGMGGSGSGGAGMGGVRATGGTGMGGLRATGGMIGTGGRAATGGMTGAGGRIGDAGTNCITMIQAGNYAFAPAPPCSACVENGNSLNAKCMMMIDCLGNRWPCTGNCKTTCLNTVGGSGPLSSCVDALESAAGCP